MIQAGTPSEPSGFGDSFKALRNRNYRRYWFSGLGMTGAQGIQQLALAWLVLDLTDSAGQLGLVVLVQGVSSGERMDYTVQKAVELGVARIQPLETSRSVVRLDDARARKRCAHWQSIAISACEQCGRNRVPEIAPVMALRNWLGQGPGGESAELRVLLAPEAHIALADLPAPRHGVCLIAGPEGGLTPEEVQDAERCGYIAARLGPRVLRTETAALAALAAMQTLWGDF